MDIYDLVKQHGRWTIRDGKQYADLSGADLSGMDLHNVSMHMALLPGANLSGANLSHANLGLTDLSGACLSGAILSQAMLDEADLSNTDLSGANLEYAYARGAKFDAAVMRDANLVYAKLLEASIINTDMSGANLENACMRCTTLHNVNLSGANLHNANLEESSIDTVTVDDRTQYYASRCPAEGEFTGWKLIHENWTYYMVELRIPSSSRRSSGTDNECRCEYAKVISITDMKDPSVQISCVTNHARTTTVYKVGETVYADSWNPDRWAICTHGIHFFMTRDEATVYARIANP